MGGGQTIRRNPGDALGHSGRSPISFDPQDVLHRRIRHTAAGRNDPGG